MEFNSGFKGLTWLCVCVCVVRWSGVNWNQRWVSSYVM